MSKTWKMSLNVQEMAQTQGLKEVKPLKHGLVNGFRHVVAHLMENTNPDNQFLEGKYYLKTSNQVEIPNEDGTRQLKLRCHKAGCKWELKGVVIPAQSMWQIPTGNDVNPKYGGWVKFTKIDQETLDKLIYSLELV